MSFNTPLDFFGVIENTVTDAFTSVRQNFNMSRFGAMDVTTNSDNYELVMIIPGVPGDDISVSVDNRILRVVANSRVSSSMSSSNNAYYQYLRNRGTITREFNLSKDADADNLSCDYKDGVLIITVPRLTSGDSTKNVSINLSESKNPTIIH